MRYRVIARRVQLFAFEIEADSEDDARERFIADGLEVEQWHEVESGTSTRSEDSLYVVSVEPTGASQ